MSVLLLDKGDRRELEDKKERKRDETNVKASLKRKLQRTVPDN